MTKTKHTPGPWVISHEYASQDDHVTIEAPPHGALAEVVWVMEDARLDGNRSPVCEANARLIAAAPELLEEHKEWASLIGQVYLLIRQGLSGDADDLIAESQVIDFPDGEPVAVSDAITKAEGGE